jgi:secretion/DNA translocation related CpaE-like protein
MTRGAAAVRIALHVPTPHLAEQVRRVAEAAGVAVEDAGRTTDPDAWVVEEPPAGALLPPRPPGSGPVIRVRGSAAGQPPRERDSDDAVIGLPADSEILLRRLGGLGQYVRARVLGVVGARGGAGASTIAAATAREAARVGMCAALVDLDAAGGGLDLLLGIEHDAGPRWADLRAERAGFPAEALSMALPRWNGVRVLSGDARGGARPGDPGVPDAVRALGSQHDLVVLDLPRNGSWVLEPVPGAHGEHLRCDAVVVVATCDVRSAAAAAVTAQALGEHHVRLVVRAPGPGGLDPAAFAEACGLPLAGTTRTERGAAAAAERGEAPADRRRGAVARTAARLLAELTLSP